MPDNCIRYTGYAYQRNLCTVTKLRSANDPPLSDETFDNIAHLYPGIPRWMSKVNKCMVEGDSVETLACAQISKSFEDFANGRISAMENVRRVAQFAAILKDYHRSPSLGDLMPGAARVFAEGASQSNNDSAIQSQLQQLRQQQIIQQGEIERQRRQQFLRDHP